MTENSQGFFGCKFVAQEFFFGSIHSKIYPFFVPYNLVCQSLKLLMMKNVSYFCAEKSCQLVIKCLTFIAEKWEQSEEYLKRSNFKLRSSFLFVEQCRFFWDWHIVRLANYNSWGGHKLYKTVQNCFLCLLKIPLLRDFQFGICCPFWSSRPPSQITLNTLQL